MGEEEESAGALFAAVAAFGCHELKRQTNLRIHGIDFADVTGMLDEATVVRRSDRHGEVRYQVFGYVHGREIAVACTLRNEGKLCWIISRRVAPAATKDEGITLVSRDDRRPGKTDWSVVDALSDAEIAAAVRADPDAVPLDFDWSEAALVLPPRKNAVSIRIDEDVLDFFRRGGPGYQSRMNAVLRSYATEMGRRKSK